MWQKRWVQWRLVLIALVLFGIAACVLLVRQGSLAAAFWFTVADAIVINLWICWGLWCWRTHSWVQWAAALVISCDVVAIVAWLCLENGSVVGAISVWGIWVMAAGFILGLATIRLIISPGIALLAVARTLVHEAIRMKVALIFIVALMLIVPVLPLVLDAEKRLAYRVETFLVWSLTSVSVLMSLLTIFLACGSICNEIGRKQIFMTMTKPISRGQYLVGKWLGIVLLNALLLVIAGAGVWVFASVLEKGQSQDEQDRAEVQRHLLVAREVRTPVPAESGGLAMRFQQKLEKLRAMEPILYAEPLNNRLHSEIRVAVMEKWYSLNPFETEIYKFTGLSSAKRLADEVQLRLKPKSSRFQPDRLVRMQMHVNNIPVDLPPLAQDTAHVIPISKTMIDKNGSMQVALTYQDPDNPNATFPATVSFPLDDGITMLYHVGSFEANLLRTLVVLWIRLSFLTTLALATGSFLGFPTACLISLMVYFTAGASGFLHESLEWYSNFNYQRLDAFGKVGWVIDNFVGKLGEGEVWEAIKIVIRLVGSSFMLLIPSFSDYNPVPLVSSGRSVPYEMIGRAALWVGVVWTGVVALLGYWIFSRRELARVMV